MADVTFLSQAEPVDEYGRALYAVSRSVLRAHFDELSQADLEDLNCDRVDVTFRQLSKLARLHRDKGLRGDGFEWAVHEAIVGRESRVTDPVGPPPATGRAVSHTSLGLTRNGSCGVDHGVLPDRATELGRRLDAPADIHYCILP